MTSLHFSLMREYAPTSLTKHLGRCRGHWPLTDEFHNQIPRGGSGLEANSSFSCDPRDIIRLTSFLSLSLYISVFPYDAVRCGICICNYFPHCCLPTLLWQAAIFRPSRTSLSLSVSVPPVKVLLDVIPFKIFIAGDCSS